LATDTFAAVAVCVVSACRGEADAHAVAGGMAFVTAGTAVIIAWVAGDAGTTHTYAGGAVCVVVASGDTLAVEAFAAVAVQVIVALCNGEADAEVVRSGPTFFVGVAALAVGGIAGGTSATGKAKS